MQLQALLCHYGLGTHRPVQQADDGAGVVQVLALLRGGLKGVRHIDKVGLIGVCNIDRVGLGFNRFVT
jgi:hypothetical protein